MVQFEERDVFMARDTQLQLLDRLGTKVVSLPHIFIEGQYLGVRTVVGPHIFVDGQYIGVRTVLCPHIFAGGLQSEIFRLGQR